MSPRILLPMVAMSLVYGFPSPALAGMPSLGLSDMAGLRMQAISFFLMGLLLSAAVIKWVWNSFQRDFPRLPRLSYPRACGLVILWGLLFVVVLTMISGARELMTPGAWTKQGLTYRLESADRSDGPGAEDELLTARRAQLARLGEVLRQYARDHDGAFPPHDQTPAIPDQYWHVADESGIRYVYVPGNRLGDASRVLAHEPSIYDGNQLAVWTDGTIAPLQAEVSLAKEAP